ncbi:Adenylosuccinate synthase [Xanthoria calcicola]
MITIVLGAQWGDEGKGKLTDILCAKASLCARAQGGNNAGHTIVANGQTYDFHILPSGLVNPKCLNLIGTGCVVHIPSFFKELEDLQRKGLDTKGRILLSDRAHVVFDLHLLIDSLQESELIEAARKEQSSDRQAVVAKQSLGGPIGTTKKGIGPAYSAKHARSGVRIHQIFNKEELDKRLRVLARAAQKSYGSAMKDYDVEAEIARFDTHREHLRSFAVNAAPLMATAQDNDTTILVEGANALMLDIDQGTYPFVTSSATGTGGAVQGLALSPFKIRNIIGVVKAYTTRVGGGPFPSEALNDDGDTLQSKGHEYGVTTGRRRRCVSRITSSDWSGQSIPRLPATSDALPVHEILTDLQGWLDLVVLRHSHSSNHYTSLNLTKLDILDHFETIRVAIAYTDPLDMMSSAPVTYKAVFPADLSVLDRCEVLYEELQGWKGKGRVAGAKSWDDLPQQARAYVEFIEQNVGVRIGYIGTGPNREDMIVRSDM